MKYINLFFLSFLFSFSSLSQVSNVEFVRTDSLNKDFHAEVQLSIDGEGGHHDETELNTGVVLAWGEGTGHFMILLEHEWRNAEGTIDKNETYSHIRYTKELKGESGDHIEFFIQAQKDRFRAIESRALVGFGYRKTNDNKILKRFNALGLGAFYESEHATELSGGGEVDIWRLNTYWHHRQNLTAKTYIENVIYYQPATNEMDDFRVLDEIRLTSMLSENVKVGFEMSISYDSSPVEGVKKNDLNYGSFIQYTF